MNTLKIIITALNGRKLSFPQKAFFKTFDKIFLLTNSSVKCSKSCPFSFNEQLSFLDEENRPKASELKLANKTFGLEDLEADVAKYDKVVICFCGNYAADFIEKFFDAKNAEFVQFIDFRAFDENYDEGYASAEAEHVAKVLASRYDTVFPTVDACIFEDNALDYVWMVRKKDEALWRFCGGFADPKDKTFEESALREAYEETGLECEIFCTVGSMQIDDWRYRLENDKIITTIFGLKIKDKTKKPEANDDIYEVKCFELDKLGEMNVQKEHLPILEKIKAYVKRYKEMLPYFI